MVWIRDALRPAQWVVVGTVVGVGTAVGIENEKMTVLAGAGAGGAGHRYAAVGLIFARAMTHLMNSLNLSTSWIFPLPCLVVVERFACPSEILESGLAWVKRWLGRSIV